MHHKPNEPRSEERATDRPPAERRPNAAAEQHHGRLFPYNAVVAVIDDPTELASAVETLAASGFAEAEVGVLCGEAGARQIAAKGERKGILARIFRVVDGLGEERGHTARHEQELRAGHFVVVVEAGDDAAKARARDGLAAHGGHYIHYYSRWATEDLVP